MKKGIIYIVFVFLAAVIPNRTVLGETSYPGPTLNVTAIVDPCINITLSTDAIIFNCKGAPGLYDANEPVVLTVGSNCGDWSVKCVATPLEGSKGEIPPERIFVKTPNSPNIDKGAGNGFEPMSGERNVLTGNPTERKEARMEFKLKTTWEDKAGTYTGRIDYTYLATP